MATQVVMPQMGESIAEGTVVRWIKKIGDKVDRDEPLFEISTDKVDAEIPSPVAGVLTEIRVNAGETVSVNSVVAVIGQTGEAAATPAAQTLPEGAPLKASPQADGAAVAAAFSEPSKPAPAATKPAPGREGQDDKRPRLDPSAAESRTAAKGSQDALRQRSSPLVRKIAKDHQVDLSQIHGTGIAGRVTK